MCVDNRSRDTSVYQARLFVVDTDASVSRKNGVHSFVSRNKNGFKVGADGVSPTNFQKPVIYCIRFKSRIKLRAGKSTCRSTRSDRRGRGEDVKLVGRGK